MKMGIIGKPVLNKNKNIHEAFNYRRPIRLECLLKYDLSQQEY